MFVKSYTIYGMYVGNCHLDLNIIGLLADYDTLTLVVASQTGTKPNYIYTTYANESD
jgi:hypothetical protein